MVEDKTIICKDCGKEFVFTVGEQEFFAEKGLENMPIRCKACRVKHKKHHRKNDRKGIVYEIVCSKCGKVETVGFEPSHARPVFCGACYGIIKNGRNM